MNLTNEFILAFFLIASCYTSNETPAGPESLENAPRVGENPEDDPVPFVFDTTDLPKWVPGGGLDVCATDECRRNRIRPSDEKFPRLLTDDDYENLDYDSKSFSFKSNFFLVYFLFASLQFLDLW